jgi:hypothetical protein
MTILNLCEYDVCKSIQHNQNGDQGMVWTSNKLWVYSQRGHEYYSFSEASEPTLATRLRTSGYILLTPHIALLYQRDNFTFFVLNVTPPKACGSY